MILFARTAAAQVYDVISVFNHNDGSGPSAALIQGTDGNLYGTTTYGGAKGLGTVFKIDLSGPTLTTLHTFASTDGANPTGRLIQGLDGDLYGTTVLGGANAAGTIFRMGTGGGHFTTIHSFVSTEGAYPYSGLIQGPDGFLYGTTYEGGANTAGMIYKIRPGGGGFTVLHNFAYADGAFPYAGLILGTDGKLYGTTVEGGADGVGTLYQMDTNGKTLTNIYHFDTTHGSDPYGGLIQATDGYLYGTTTFGGSYGVGTIFKVHTGGAGFVVLHYFGNGTGAQPYAGLLQGTDGNLYGTATYGGSLDLGTVFKFDIANDTAVVLHEFSGTEGSYSTAGLLQASNGNFYGVATSGGSGAAGVVFGIVQTCFTDVQPSDPFSAFICKITQDGIAAGCGGGKYCPDDPVTRAQMAVFLLRAEHGSSYTPPACTPPGTFADVPCPGGFAVDWVEQLSTEGVTAGCGGGNYCPDDASSRGQMAVFLVKTFGL